MRGDNGSDPRQRILRPSNWRHWPQRAFKSFWRRSIPGSLVYGGFGRVGAVGDAAGAEVRVEEEPRRVAVAFPVGG